MRLAAIRLAERKFAQGKLLYTCTCLRGAHRRLAGRWERRIRSRFRLYLTTPIFPRVMTAGGPEVKELAAKTSEAWIQFARSGNPNHKALPNWPVYTVGERATMVFDKALQGGERSRQ